MSREVEASMGGTLCLLTAVFAVLRAANVIDWPWWAVVSPILIGPAIIVVLLGLFAVVAVIALVGLWLVELGQR